MDNVLKSKVRRSGGALILSIPKAVQEALELTVDSAVSLSVVRKKLLVEPVRDVTLESLLNGLGPEDFAPTEEDKIWMDSEVGGEAIQ